MSDSKNSYSPANDPDRYFRTDHLEGDLKGRSIRSGAATMVAQASKLVLRIVSLIVFARLLAPENFGLIAMVGTVTNFIVQFKDLGLSQATVQRAQINHKQVSTLFWINVALSWGLMLLTIALAPGIAWFYRDRRLVEIAIGLSVGFIFSGLTVQHQALLMRQMRFGTLSAIDIISMAIGIAIGIIAILFGAGYWGLVFVQLATSFTNMVGVWVTCNWRPGLPVRKSGVRSMLVFGSNLTGFSVVNYISGNLDNVLIGTYLGPEQLGLYTRAYQLLLLPSQQINTPITNVALPTLSRLQNDAERYRQYYLKGVELIVTLGMPVVAFLCVAADRIILSFMGPKWGDAIPIFQLLSPAAFIITFNVATAWVYTSLGRTDRQFRWSFVRSAVTATCFIIGINWGSVGVASAYSISFLFTLIPGIIYCYKGTPLQLRDLATTISKPVLASIGAALMVRQIDMLLLGNIHGGVGLLVDTILYGLLYIAIWMVLPNGKNTLLNILKLTKDLRQKPKGDKGGKQ